MSCCNSRGMYAPLTARQSEREADAACAGRARWKQAYLVEKIIKDVPDELDEVNTVDADVASGGRERGMHTAAPSRIVINDHE